MVPGMPNMQIPGMANAGVGTGDNTLGDESDGIMLHAEFA